MKKMFIIFALVTLSACKQEKQMEEIMHHQYMVRYNVSAFPEMYTTGKITWRGPNTIQFTDQNGVNRKVSGTFEIIYLPKE